MHWWELLGQALAVSGTYAWLFKPLAFQAKRLSVNPRAWWEMQSIKHDVRWKGGVQIYFTGGVAEMRILTAMTWLKEDGYDTMVIDPGELTNDTDRACARITSAAPYLSFKAWKKDL